MDPLERILAVDEAVEPRPAFVSWVMETVRREAAVPPPIPFPWRRALPGLVVGGALIAFAVLTSIATIAAALLEDLATAPAAPSDTLLASPAFAWALAALACCYPLVRAARQLAGASR